MDIQALQAFIAVAERQSFSKGAEQLFITQSAISKRISTLESQLDTALFDRIARQVTLTEAGRALLPRAKALLIDLEDTRREIKNLSGAVSGTLSLAASHHISLHRLPLLLKEYSQMYPKVKLDLRFEESEVGYSGVLQGDIELAIITLSPQPNENIHSVPIWRDRMQFVVSPEHPLAHTENITLESLTQYSAILPSTSTFTRQLLEQRFQDEALSLDVSMSTNNLDTIRMMVSIGLGWSLLPESLIGDDLTILSPNEPPIFRELGVIHHRNRSLSNAARQLLDMLGTLT
ncbi:MAG: LysR family transcriptional regulator [Pontibacterium sp.]